VQAHNYCRTTTTDSTSDTSDYKVFANNRRKECLHYRHRTLANFELSENNYIYSTFKVLESIYD